MRSKNSLLFTTFLVLGDTLAVISAYILAFILRANLSATPTFYQIPTREFFTSLLVFLPFIIIFFSLIGTYVAKPQKKFAQISRLIFGALGAMLFMIMIHYFSRTPIFPSKLVPIYGLIFSVIFLSLVRGILYFLRFLRRRQRIGLIDTVIIGDTDISRNLRDNILRDKTYKIQAVVGDSKFATHKTFHGAIRNFTPDLIIQVATREAPDINPEILDFAAKNFVAFKFVPREVSELTERLELELFMGDIPVLSVEPTRLTGWNLAIKRAFDFTLSLIFIIIFSWLYLLIWLAEKISDFLSREKTSDKKSRNSSSVITSRGVAQSSEKFSRKSRKSSAIFHQLRLTRGDQKFKLYKFRTQFAKFDGTTPEQAFAKLGKPELAKKYRINGDFLEDDPRVTKLGKFLRKTSLDELPQIFNVLKGDISLVGPRALIPEELNQFRDKHKILNVKSGITGLAQISGRRDLPWQQRRQLDVFYVQNWSFTLDLQILAKTFLQVITRRGAQ